jgi:GMP synthase (glutamine-hydrolysing)
MQDILAIRHVAFEHLGSLAPLLTGRGFRIRYLDAGSADLATLDATKPALLAVLGGPIGAYEEDQYPFLRDELRLIEARLAAERPLLGICLGAQLIARVLGSRVYPGRVRELGWAPLDLTRAGRAGCLAGLEACGRQVLHWHGDTFDLSAGSERLASTAITDNQAFSLGSKVLGLQFHLELDPADFERWLIGHALEISQTEGVSPSLLRAATARHGPGLATAAAACMTRWFTGAGLFPPAAAG